MVRFAQGRPAHGGNRDLQVQGDLSRRPRSRPPDAEAGPHHSVRRGGRRGGAPVGRAPTGTLAGSPEVQRADQGRCRVSGAGREGLGSAALVKLLLDTPIWLWSLLAPEDLSRRVARALENADNELWLSAVSVGGLVVLGG